MESNPQTSGPGVLEDLRGLPAEEVAARIDSLIGDAAGPNRDAEIAELLADRRFGDPILEHLSLDSLETITERCITALTQATSDVDARSTRQRAWWLLDVLRRSSLLTRFQADETTDAWATRILALVDTSHFTFGHLLSQRAAGYGERWPSGWLSGI